MVKLLKNIIKLITHRIFLIPLLMIAQIALIFLIVLDYKEYIVHFYLISSVISILMTLYIINGKSNPSYKIAWIIPVMGLPIFGVILYFIFGMNKVSEKEKEKLKKIYYKSKENLDKNLILEELKYESIVALGQAKYITEYSPSTVCKHTKTTYLKNGEEYYNYLIKTLKNAKKYIFLEYFIISKGYMWTNILNILKEKIKEGVEVRIIYDDFG